VGFELGRDQTADGNTLTEHDLPVYFWGVNYDGWESAESRLQQQVVDVQRFGKLWLGGRDSNPDNVVQSHVSYR
jgi:hypothetical protein